MIILPVTYLGDIRYYSTLLSAEDCVVDIGEHYVKQTNRNRCDILTANGRASLTVNVIKGGSKVKRPVKDIRIDYSKRWQHQHWLSLVSAYRGSPYFEHFEEFFAPFYERRHEFLADLNLQLTDVIIRLLGITAPHISETYIEASAGDVDLRGGIFAHTLGGRSYHEPCPYYQVFSDRFPFESDLSIFDLLMCEGTGAKDVLMRQAVR